MGIYAVFGAFIAGIAMPRGRFADAAIGHLEPLTTTFLLPVFFVYSGLNTQIALLDSPAIWRVAVILVALAIAGKGVNIGLQRGVITPTLFTIMVLMAVVTTLMASPLFELVYGRRAAAAAQKQAA